MCALGPEQSMASGREAVGLACLWAYACSPWSCFLLLGHNPSPALGENSLGILFTSLRSKYPGSSHLLTLLGTEVNSLSFHFLSYFFLLGAYYVSDPVLGTGVHLGVSGQFCPLEADGQAPGDKVAPASAT